MHLNAARLAVHLAAHLDPVRSGRVALKLVNGRPVFVALSREAGFHCLYAIAESGPCLALTARRVLETRAALGLLKLTIGEIQCALP
jgi:hypothetical protein